MTRFASARGGSSRLLWPLLILFFCAQLAFAHRVAPLREAIEEMPPPHSARALDALSLGDREFLFRFLARWLEDVGDGGGRVKPLRDYDYDRVVGWLRILDMLDPDAEYSHELAAHYFGAVSDPTFGPARVGKIAEYFRGLAMEDPQRHWQWLLWSVGAAQRRGADPLLAARLAQSLVSLRNAPDVPPWLPLAAVRLYRMAGDERAARALENDPALAAVRKQVIRELADKRASESEGAQDKRSKP